MVKGYKNLNHGKVMILLQMGIAYSDVLLKLLVGVKITMRSYGRKFAVT